MSLRNARLRRVSNAATVEQAFALWGAGRLEDVRQYMDPEIEWIEPPETIGRSVVTGPDPALASLVNWIEQFDTLRAETVELREEGDRVFHAMQQYATVRGSTAEIAGELYMVWWFRDGKAARMEMYNTREDAEAAFARAGF
jgi:ketosteroid isomerase-like protein